MKTENYSKSFLPIIGVSPKYLILGTMPGKESLRLQQYYAHPQNLFWKILFTLFNTKIVNSYSHKVKFIIQHQIALWDICHSCYRKGSLDSNIQEEIPNAILELIDKNPTIRKIIFNGQKAEKLYKKYFELFDEIEYVTALSTSPANATFTFKQKLNNWETIKN